MEHQLMKHPRHPIRMTDVYGFNEETLVKQAIDSHVPVYCSPNLVAKYGLPENHVLNGFACTEPNSLFYFEKHTASPIITSTYISSSTMKLMRFVQQGWLLRFRKNEKSAYRMYLRTVNNPEKCELLDGQQFITVDEANNFLGIKPEEGVFIEKTKEFSDFEYKPKEVPIDSDSKLRRHRIVNQMFGLKDFSDKSVKSFGKRFKTIDVFDNGIGQYDFRTEKGNFIRVIGKLEHLGNRFIAGQYEINKIIASDIPYRAIPRDERYYDLIVSLNFAKIIQYELKLTPVSYTVRFGPSIVMESKIPPFSVNGKPKGVISLESKLRNNRNLEKELMEPLI